MKKLENCITLGVNLNENYLPLLDVIDKIAIEQEKSRSSVVREMLCEHLGFQPEKVAHKYSSMKHLMAEI